MDKETLAPAGAPNGSPPSAAVPACTSSGVSRRSFLQTLGVSAAANSLVGLGASTALAEQPAADGPKMFGPGPSKVMLKVNGKEMAVTIEPATTLLEALRFGLDITGCKEICDRGSCGGCSAIVEGKLVNTCMMLAADAIGSDVQTVEGLAQGDKLHPIQEAFIKHDGLQCGYCTPGLVMACKSMLDKNQRPTLQQIKVGISGNICRCGTYNNIFNACLEASGQKPIVEA